MDVILILQADLWGWVRF